MTASGHRIASAADLIVLARVIGRVTVAQPVGHLHGGNSDVLLGALLKATTNRTCSLIVDLEHVWFDTAGFVAAFAPLQRGPGIPVVLVGNEYEQPELAGLCGMLPSISLETDPVTAFRAALSVAARNHSSPSSEARITASWRLDTPSLR